MADRVERPLITLPWSEKYFQDAEKAQAVEDEDRQLRVEMLKQKLYPVAVFISYGTEASAGCP